jgi:hypothetical protein
MRPADLFLDFLRRILCFRINPDFGSKLTRESHLFRTQVHCRDVQPHGLGILNGHVAQAAYSRDHHSFTGPRLGHFQSFVRGHARAEDGRRIHKRKILGKSSQII